MPASYITRALLELNICRFARWATAIVSDPAAALTVQSVVKSVDACPDLLDNEPYPGHQECFKA